jgi:hypothetical protein
VIILVVEYMSVPLSKLEGDPPVAVDPDRRAVTDRRSRLGIRSMEWLDLSLNNGMN